MKNIINRIKKIGAFIWILWLSVSLSYAQSLTIQSDKSLDELHQISDVKQAIEIVLAENPDLATYLLKQLKAEREYKNQRGTLLPTLNGSVNGTRFFDQQTTALPGEIFGQPGESVSVTLGSAYNFSAGVTLSRNIIDIQNLLRIKQAKINIDLQNAQTGAFRQKLIEQTAFYYYAILITQESIVNQQENQAIADSILTFTESNYSQGLVDLASVNLSKISANNIRQTIQNNGTMLMEYKMQLKVLMGLDVNKSLQISAVIEPRTVMFAEFNGLASDQNLFVYKIQQEQSLADIRVKRAALYPKLSANIYLGGQQLRDDINLSFSDGAWTPYTYAGLTLTVPIFNHSSWGNLRLAKINHEIASQTLTTETLKSELADQQLVIDYEGRLSQLKILLENYTLFKQNADLAYDKYQAGIIGLDLYFRTFEDYLKSENNYLNGLSSVYNAYAKILSRQ